jgi:hypothetical protein
MTWPSNPTFNGLTISGVGDTWIELDNNTSFSSDISGKYGLRFLNGVLQKIINGVATDIAGGTLQITESNDDPSFVLMTPGDVIVSRSSGDMFVKTSTGGYTYAGVYTPDVATYTLTVTDPGNGDAITTNDAYINCGNGGSDCSHAYAANSTPQVTAIPASGRTFTAWTGDLTDTSTTTNPDTVTMDANRALGATFSAAASSLTAYIVGSEANGAALSTGSGTVTVSGMTYADNHNSVANGAFLNASGYAQIQTAGNIDYGVGKISFWVYPTAAQSAQQYRYLLSDAVDYHAFCLVHEADNQLRFRTTSGSAYFSAATSTSLLTQNAWHFVELTWSDVADQVTLRIDGGTVNTQALAFTGATESASFRLFNSSAGGTSGYQGRFDSVSIYSTTTGQ